MDQTNSETEKDELGHDKANSVWLSIAKFSLIRLVVLGIGTVFFYLISRLIGWGFPIFVALLVTLLIAGPISYKFDQKERYKIARIFAENQAAKSKQIHDFNSEDPKSDSGTES